jgi:hypothetical protein
MSELLAEIQRACNKNSEKERIAAVEGVFERAR